MTLRYTKKDENRKMFYFHPTLSLKDEGHRENGTSKSDRLNACVQFSEPRIGFLKSNRANGPIEYLKMLDK